MNIHSVSWEFGGWHPAQPQGQASLKSGDLRVGSWRTKWSETERAVPSKAEMNLCKGPRAANCRHALGFPSPPDRQGLWRKLALLIRVATWLWRPSSLPSPAGKPHLLFFSLFFKTNTQQPRKGQQMMMSPGAFLTEFPCLAWLKIEKSWFFSLLILFVLKT